MAKKFDIRQADAQATHVEPVNPASFDLDKYAEYSHDLDLRCKSFTEADSGSSSNALTATKRAKSWEMAWDSWLTLRTQL